jgi:hypothetical protein
MVLLVPEPITQSYYDTRERNDIQPPLWWGLVWLHLVRGIKLGGSPLTCRAFIKRRYMKIIVAMPTRGLIITEVQMALDRELSANEQIPIVLYSYDIPLPISRNYLIESALKLDWDSILLIDDDVILPEGGLKQLIDLDVDVAVMDYPARMLQGGLQVSTAVLDKDKSLAWAGLGSTLVKRKVFEKLAQPWFIFTNHKINRDKDGRIGFYAGQQQESNTFSGGEDVHFFLQCRKEGFSMKVTKKIAKHCYLDHIVSPVANSRYQQQHKITKRDKIEESMV